MYMFALTSYTAESQRLCPVVLVCRKPWECCSDPTVLAGRQFLFVVFMFTGLLFTVVLFVRQIHHHHHHCHHFQPQLPALSLLQIIMFLDLECNYINPIDLCNKLNQVRISDVLL
jgi:bacteriorhodopsin